MEFTDVIKTRTSMRSYCDKEVEEDKINYILDCARLAPSWVNHQCWWFIVVKNKETITALSKTSVINRWLKNIPVIIVACGEPQESGNNNNIEYYTVDVAIATEHLILAATNVGLGTCWIAGFNEEKVKEILGIPKRVRVVALTPLGYAEEKKTLTEHLGKTMMRSTKRKSLSEIVRYEKW